MGCDDRGAQRTLSAPAVFIAAAWVSLAWAAPSGATPAILPPPIRLPRDVTYSLAVGADSAVVFSHRTHVALAANRCTACHPQTFRILSPTTRVAHREMNSGQLCGSCHDGRQAFGVRDSAACSSCHSGRRAVVPVVGDGAGPGTGGPRGPGPIQYAKSEASPGPVTFDHPVHAGKKLACAGCHPRPFAMKASGRSGPALHEPVACGACHDGVKAFGVGEAEACGRCHGGRAP